MRKLLTILAILGLSISFTALTARADTTVDYTVNGTFGLVTGFPSTSLSNAGDSFTITFSVDQALLVSGGAAGVSAPIPVSFDYTDFLGNMTNFSLTNQAGTVTFFDESNGGLFQLEFFPAGGDDFLLSLSGLGLMPGAFLGSNMNTGTFLITPGDATGAGSSLGDFTNLAVDSVSGTVTATAVSTPEPSSLLLLGSGFLALGGFARKRLIARFN
jgi:PEP-CTERM motif